MSLSFIGDDLSEPGKYDVLDVETWGRCSPRRGQVLVCQVPQPLVGETEVEAAFLVVHRSLMSDGSLCLQVKSLGSSSVKATPKLSSQFNRKVGFLHMCMLAGLCKVTEGITFHVQKFELCHGEDFSRDYVIAAGKKILKQVLQEDQNLEGPPAERGDEAEEIDDRFPYSPEPLPGGPSGKGRGDGIRGERPELEKEADLKARGLRERLERVKEREIQKKHQKKETRESAERRPSFKREPPLTSTPDRGWWRLRETSMRWFDKPEKQLSREERFQKKILCLPGWWARVRRQLGINWHWEQRWPTGTRKDHTREDRVVVDVPPRRRKRRERKRRRKEDAGRKRKQEGARAEVLQEDPAVPCLQVPSPTQKAAGASTCRPWRRSRSIVRAVCYNSSWTR